MEFLRILEGIRNPFLTFIFTIFTEAAGEAVLLAVLCILFWCVSKKTAYVMGFVFMGAQLVTNNLKLIFRIERPWILDPDFKPVESAVKGATGYSFPSGHTTSATSVYGTIGMKLKGKAFKILAAVVIAGVMFSRMYLGVHTPLDVSVAFLTTAAALCICLLVEKKCAPGSTRDLVICVCFGLCAVASVIFAFILTKNGIVLPLNSADSCKTAGAALAFVLSWYIERKYINFNERGCRWPLQILKVILGVAVILGVRAGLKVLFTIGSDTEPVVLGSVRYFFVVFCAMTIYPMIIKRFFETSGKEKTAEEQA